MEAVSQRLSSIVIDQATLGHFGPRHFTQRLPHAISESQRRAVDKVAEIVSADVRKVAEGTENEKIN